MLKLQRIRRFGIWLALGLMSLLLTISCSHAPIFQTLSSNPSSSNRVRTYDYMASSAPAIAQGVMYFGGEARSNGLQFTSVVFAVETETERERWRFKLPNASQVGYPPVMAEGVLYVGTFGSQPHVYALDTQTGQLQWQAAAKGNVLSPVVMVDGVVCFRSLDGYLYALDALTGNLKWSFPTQGALQPIAVNASFQGRPDEVMSAPTVADGMIYVGTRGGLYALDAQTGEPQWKFATNNWVQSTPLVQEGRVYIGSGSADRAQGNIYGLDAQSGELQWQYSATEGMVDSNLAIADGVIYFGGNSPNLHAVDLVTQHEKWRFPTRSSTHATVPFVHNGNVFFGFEEIVYALDVQTGNLDWQYAECRNCEGYPPFIQGPVLNNGTLYYLLRNKIYAFDVPHTT